MYSFAYAMLLWLSIVVLRFFYAVAHSCSLFTVVAIYYSTVQLNNLLNYSNADEHLGYFQFFPYK
jgi:hypothetical protein